MFPPANYSLREKVVENDELVYC